MAKLGDSRQDIPAGGGRIRSGEGIANVGKDLDEQGEDRFRGVRGRDPARVPPPERTLPGRDLSKLRGGMAGGREKPPPSQDRGGQTPQSPFPQPSQKLGPPLLRQS